MDAEELVDALEATISGVQLAETGFIKQVYDMYTGGEA
jgi:hypothetical protein